MCLILCIYSSVFDPYNWASSCMYLSPLRALLPAGFASLATRCHWHHLFSTHGSYVVPLVIEASSQLVWDRPPCLHSSRLGVPALWPYDSCTCDVRVAWSGDVTCCWRLRPCACFRVGDYLSSTGCLMSAMDAGSEGTLIISSFHHNKHVLSPSYCILHRSLCWLDIGSSFCVACSSLIY